MQRNNLVEIEATLAYSKVDQKTKREKPPLTVVTLFAQTNYLTVSINYGLFSLQVFINY